MPPKATGPKWTWETDDGTFADYQAKTNTLLEKTFQENQATLFATGVAYNGGKYELDFKKMTQKNLESGKVRRIARSDPAAPLSAAVAPASAPTPAPVAATPAASQQPAKWYWGDDVTGQGAEPVMRPFTDAESAELEARYMAAVGGDIVPFSTHLAGQEFHINFIHMCYAVAGRPSKGHCDVLRREGPNGGVCSAAIAMHDKVASDSAVPTAVTSGWVNFTPAAPVATLVAPKLPAPSQPPAAADALSVCAVPAAVSTTAAFFSSLTLTGVSAIAAPAHPSAATPAMAAPVKWLCADEFGTECEFDRRVTTELEARYRAAAAGAGVAPFVLNVLACDYEFDFPSMTMTNVWTDESRCLFRRCAADVAGAKALARAIDDLAAAAPPAGKRPKRLPVALQHLAGSPALKAHVPESGKGASTKPAAAAAVGPDTADPYSGYKGAIVHATPEGAACSAYLTQATKFYVIQLLKTAEGQWAVFTRWGKLGATGQTAHDKFGSADDAMKTFRSKFREKTKNDWNFVSASPSNFVLQSGKYAMSTQAAILSGGGGGGGDDDDDE